MACYQNPLGIFPNFFDFQLHCDRQLAKPPAMPCARRNPLFSASKFDPHLSEQIVGKAQIITLAIKALNLFA